MADVTLTVDNLGLDPSVRWAQDQQEKDASFLTDITYAPIIPKHTTVEVRKPAFLSELARLFDTAKKGKAWAATNPPRGYALQKNRLFTERGLVPSIDSDEALVDLDARVQGQVNSLTDVDDQLTGSQILHAIQSMRSLGKDLAHVQKERGRFQRG